MKRFLVFVVLICAAVSLVLLQPELPRQAWSWIQHRLNPPPPRPVTLPAPTLVPTATPTPTPTATPAPSVTPTPSPTPTPGPDPLAWLLSRKDHWPPSVVLNAATEFPLLFNGKVAGSAKVPAGTVLKVSQIDSQWVTVFYSGTVHRVSIGNTDVLRQAQLGIDKELAAAAKNPLPAQVTPTPAAKEAEPEDDEAKPSLALPTGKLADRRYARYLRTKGREIHDRTGKVVQLRGVNIGGWLVTEGWMCGQTDDGGRGALEQIEKRFGPEKAAALMKAWQDHWFTTKDLDRIKGYGFNMIRVPFGYRNLQNADGKWIRNAKGEIDFSRLDWLVDESGKRDIYVILDLHRWPGEYGFPSRWSKEGIECRAKMVTLWKEVARHYRDNGDIAAFDVINEPEGSPGNAPHHDFYNAIRAHDPRRMIVQEWVSYSKLNDEKWSNVVWSSHYPEDSDKTLPRDKVEDLIVAFEKKEKLTEAPGVHVPVFIGEMKAPQDNADSARALVKALDKRGWHWAVWTYKGVNNGGWASFNYHQELKYDLANDSYDDILTKWSTGLSEWQHSAKPANCSFNGWWIEGFTEHRN